MRKDAKRCKLRTAVGKFAKRTLMLGGVQSTTMKADAAEQGADAATHPAGPLTGQTVRICAETASRRWFGKSGVVAGHNEAAGVVELEGVEMLRNITVPADSVVLKSSLKDLKQKTLRNLDNLTKRSWLLSAGFFRETLVELPLCANRVQGKAPVEIGKEEVFFWWKYTAWRLEALEKPVVCVDPWLVYLWSEAVRESLDPTEEFSDESATLAVYRLKMLRRHWDAAELMLVPIWSSRHWTLLVLQKTTEADGSPGAQVRYVDTLQQPSVKCRQLARRFINALDDLPVTRAAGDLERWNCSRQDELECGFAVCWYTAEFLRAFLGAGFGSSGWLNCWDTREELTNLLKNLSLFSVKLAAEWEATESRLRADVQRRLESVRRLEDQDRRQQVLEALQILAEELLGEGLTS